MYAAKRGVDCFLACVLAINERMGLHESHVGKAVRTSHLHEIRMGFFITAQGDGSCELNEERRVIVTRALPF